MPGAAHEPQLDLERIDRLLAKLELELQKTGADTPTAQELKMEMETLRAMIESAQAGNGVTTEKHHSIRASFQNMTDRLEGEVLKDAPYIAEIGRILGLT
ncbi:MAG: hypothetical protein JWQ00_140 [Noviherbaspirillum sp.]|jgi:NAD(P)H-dependent FMN reductase|nr:hypothetical protein [Noviherbaspirillum sp.]